MHDGILHCYNGYHGLGKRQHKAEEKSDVIASVNLGGLQQFLWNRVHKEGSRHNHLRNPDGAGQDHNP